jgi:CRISPR-associated exonuclease Cas4
MVEFRPEPFPVEYKRGARKPTDSDLVQLCSLALCIEVNLNYPLQCGAILWPTRRRIEITFDLGLRTESLTTEAHFSSTNLSV